MEVGYRACLRVGIVRQRPRSSNPNNDLFCMQRGCHHFLLTAIPELVISSDLFVLSLYIRHMSSSGNKVSM